jgi:peptidoglycan hydrolase-like protein with peptidoglycan-binding domain
MYAGLAFQPSHYSGLHYGAPPEAGYPCIKKGATDKASGGAVSAVQNALTSKFGPLLRISSNHFSEKMTLGTFGDETDRIVRAFQDLQGLAADGIVGPVTGKKLGLEFQNCTAKIETTAAPVDTGGGEPGFFKKIDIFRQTDPGLFYGGIAMTGLVLFAGTAIFLNESGRIPSTAAPKKRKSKKRRKSRKGRRK